MYACHKLVFAYIICVSVHEHIINARTRIRNTVHAYTFAVTHAPT